MDVLVHYGEIALKGKNRAFFENKLIDNIKRATSAKVKKYHGYLLVTTDSYDALKHVFGIEWYSPAQIINKSYNDLRDFVIKEIPDKVNKKKSFALRVRRADKTFPFSSQQIAQKLGKVVIDQTKSPVDLDNPDVSIYIEISDKIYLYFEKHKGPGGLPVGVSGRVLCLLSGGLDSAVSTYLMMKRGCRVDFIHFHAFPDNKYVRKTKIDKIAHYLTKYQLNSKLFVVPYTQFQLSYSAKKIGYETVVFRRLMVRVAEGLAVKEEYRAIVMGDSVGQVASQTLENLALVDEAVSTIILRPLVGFDKQEIIDAAQKIGVYELCISPYKDCCSIITSKPKTKAKRKEVVEIEKEINIDTIINKTIHSIKSYGYFFKSSR